MSENTQESKGLFETLEEKSSEYSIQENTITRKEHAYSCSDEEQKFEFLVQDMFLDHFFP